MNYLRLIGICLIVGHFSFCTTTLSPGFFYNNTAEHIYPEKTTTQLGSGRILKMEKSFLVEMISQSNLITIL